MPRPAIGDISIHEWSCLSGGALAAAVGDTGAAVPITNAATITHLENKRMKITVWNVAPFLTLLTLAPAHSALSAGRAAQTVAEKAKDAAEDTKDAIVKGARVVADKTEDGLSKTGEVMTDGWITTRINERFVGEKLLKNSDINVDTSKHVVTLKGTVMGPAGRARAAMVARRTEGVHRVINRLTIGPKHTD